MKALEQRIADFCTFMIEQHFNPNQQQHHDSIAEEMLKEVDDIDELIDN